MKTQSPPARFPRLTLGILCLFLWQVAFPQIGTSAEISIGTQISQAGAPSPTDRESYNVHAFGAIGDGKNLDSQAINKAIEICAQAGGGTVYFTAGTYASYSIHLKSNVALYLDHGATILAADPATRGRIRRIRRARAQRMGTVSGFRSHALA